MFGISNSKMEKHFLKLNLLFESGKTYYLRSKVGVGMVLVTSSHPRTENCLLRIDSKKLEPRTVCWFDDHLRTRPPIRFGSLVGPWNQSDQAFLDKSEYGLV